MKMKNKVTKAKWAMTGALMAFVLCLGLSNMVYSNNVTISNSYLGHDTIKFDVQWDNSWRNTGTANSTMNYDGVWVFVKYRDACDKPGISNYPAAYSHVWLINDTAYHTVSNTVLKSMGTTNISGTDRAMGIFLYRKNDGTGTFPTGGNTQVILKWDQAAQGTANGNYDIRINAIEMVYIPQGAFRLGSGNQTMNGPTSYNYCTNVTGLMPYVVTWENQPIYVNQVVNQVGGVYTYNYSATGTVAATFPKGYDAYWCMKYEISQGQYVDYLNSLDRQEQINSSWACINMGMSIATTTVSDAYRWAMYSGTVANPWNPVYRQYIRMPPTVQANMPITFGCDANNNAVFNEALDGQNVACNYLDYDNFRFLRKYLDWAALRPMSDWEYEKTCRGPVANVAYQTYEIAWGLDGSAAGNRNPSTGITNPAANNETPVPAPGTVTGLYIANNATGGPLRVGSTHGTVTRVQAGSSYYGVADMAGNVHEYVVMWGNHPSAGNQVYGTQLSRTDLGDGDMQTVPPAIWYTSGGTNYYWKGGAWDVSNANWQYFLISWRGGHDARSQNSGGRGVRTAQ